MDRTLKTSVVRDVKGEITNVYIEVAGWRIDVDTDMKHGSGVCIANVAVDGPEAGWCACAFDPTIKPGDIASLTLNGTESE